MHYLFEDYSLDTDRRELRRGTNLLSVAPQVFDLLNYLIRNRERVVTKEDLIGAIWDGRVVSDAALTTRLNVARNAIGDSGDQQRLIKTLPRKGFRFVAPVAELGCPKDRPTNANPALRQRISFCKTADGVRIAYATAGAAYRWSRPPTGSTTLSMIGNFRSGDHYYMRLRQTTA